ncbi:glycosaminoglycan xylosylkinase homolog [Cydia splendana]|uniref:glycosaminoglycan xylosylkinase homolog n=1 Tax=Cydia splendana TaxID=1100963 RepID=UPI0028F4A92B
MSMNYVFGFSLFLLLLVALNIYFFYTLIPIGKKSVNFNVPSIKLDQSPSVFKDIYDYLNYLPSQYKSRNSKFFPLQRTLLTSFSPSDNIQDDWPDLSQVGTGSSLYPHKNGVAGQMLHAMKTAPIVLVDNAPKGTQLKLLLLLEGKQKLYFKPKRYERDHIIHGSIVAGFDRHNSEVFAYYLAMTLNFTWIPPSVIRKIHVDREIVSVATIGLKRTMIRNGNGGRCIYGKCFYCKINETVCPDNKGEIEGAAILYLDKPFQFQVFKSPWHRNYRDSKLMEWQRDNDFCKKVTGTLSTKRILDLVDISIFDFLIQNGDRHRYEMYKDRILLLDNGKGLGNPAIDELDILAPLYQCCILRLTTWKYLELLSGGSLTETIKLMSEFQGGNLVTEDHFKAMERRLLKVYATVQYCIGRQGSAKVFKT